MNLKARLSRLQTQAGTGGTAPPGPAMSTLRNRLAQLRPDRLRTQATRRTMPAGELAQALGGELIDEGVIRIRSVIPLTGRLGAIDLASVHPNPQLPTEAGSDGRRQVYIDTETTGLSGGSGTLAFLTGIAVIEANAIVLTQFLITRFSAEASMLSALAGLLTPADRLVSYNGKSYDLPLLLTRFRMQGLKPIFEDLPHLDLLHPVRRLFSRRWNDCRLLSLEENLLGFKRVDDLPGSEAPAAWFGYLRNGSGSQLVRVVAHNRQDILSLAVAHSTLMQAIENPRAFAADLYALARWLAETDEDAALELLRSHATVLCMDGQRLLATLSRRAGRWPQAVAIWETLAAGGCVDSLEHLAKYHEHISKDLDAAQRYCALLPGDDAYAHRRRRLARKTRHKRCQEPLVI